MQLLLIKQSPDIDRGRRRTKILNHIEEGLQFVCFIDIRNSTGLMADSAGFNAHAVGVQFGMCHGRTHIMTGDTGGCGGSDKGLLTSVGCKADGFGIAGNGQFGFLGMTDGALL